MGGQHVSDAATGLVEIGGVGPQFHEPRANENPGAGRGLLVLHFAKREGSPGQYRLQESTASSYFRLLLSSLCVLVPGQSANQTNQVAVRFLLPIATRVSSIGELEARPSSQTLMPPGHLLRTSCGLLCFSCVFLAFSCVFFGLLGPQTQPEVGRLLRPRY
jgi:hypothetical protein